MDINYIKQQLNAYAAVEISADLHTLSDKQKKIISELIAAGQYADTIFWRQSSHDALTIRQQFSKQSGPIKEFIDINYGPYDRLNNHKRFVGEGPDKKPLGAGFYPEDLTREDFVDYINDYPKQKNNLQSLFTVIEWNQRFLKTTPYFQYYEKETNPMIGHLEKAAELTENPSLRSYLTKRAFALATDAYYQSDLAWMDLCDHQIDIVIGPIENYEDNLFNYKAAYEAAVMVRDDDASRELEIYKQHLDHLERNLPIADKYKKESVGSGNILEIVNVVYFGGDFQAGVKTIAASLPNDEKVITEKGAKKQLYKNIMEAKFEHILQPIAGALLESRLQNHLSKKHFISQVLLHEISHTIGPNYVAGKSESVRRALRDRYSIIEECKADVLGIYSMAYFENVFVLSKQEILAHYITYLAGLFRSIRFGVEEAHGLSNLIQLNYLLQEKVISRNSQSKKYALNPEKFHPAISTLANQLLMIEAAGDYDKAGELIERYGTLNMDTAEDLENLTQIPRDLDLTFNLDL